jgi:hypothetical protein
MRATTAIAALLAAAATAACGARPPPPPAAPPPAVAERLGPFEWLVGRWQRDDGGGVEQWSVAEGALVGVGFTVEGGRTRAYEVMIIRVADGRATFTAMPNGAVGVDFPEAEKTSTRVTFENPEHDFPKSIGYALEAPDVLVATIGGDDAAPEVLRFRAAAAAPAPELVTRAAALGGADAGRWAAAFEPRGVIWRAATGRLAGREAIRAALAAPSDGGGLREARAVTASGLSPAGDAGFTLGPTHASVWRRQPDGAWLLAYDMAF